MEKNIDSLITARSVGLINFLQEASNFVIPNYQRKYVWKRRNCRRLLDDMIGCIKEDKGHFIGSIVFRQKVARPSSPLDLVDGQQRITTIMMIIKVLSLFDKEKKIQQEINKILFSNNSLENNKFKLAFNNEDKEVFSYIMKKQDYDGSEDKTLKENLMFQNFCYIFNYLRNKIGEEKIQIEDIFKKGLENFYLIDVALTDMVNPQEIFESINSLGMKLGPADEIKNYLLWQLGDNASRMFEENWKPIEEEIGDKKIDDFFMYYLMAKQSRVVKEKELYDEYKKYANGKDPNWLIEDLAKYARYFSAFLGKNNHNEYSDTTNELLKEIREIGLTTVYSFLLCVFDDMKSGKIDEKTLDKILNLLVIYLVRRTICQIPSGGLRGFMASLYKSFTIHECQNESYYATIYNLLINNNARGRKMPDNGEMQEELIGNKLNLYGPLSKFCKYLFFRITNKRYPDPSHYVVSIKDVSLEHIIPQHYGEKWKETLGPNFKEVDEWLNTLGNLTFLSKEENSRASNKSYEEKIKLYPQGTLNNLNAMMNEYNEFTLDKIHERAKKLADNISELYKIDVPSQEILDSIQINNKEPVEEKISFDDDYQDMTGKNPLNFLLEQEEHKVSVWPDVLEITCNYCGEKNLNKLLDCFNHNENIISKQPNLKKYSWRKINGTQYYIKVHGSNNDLFAKIVKLIHEFDLEAFATIISNA